MAKQPIDPQVIIPYSQLCDLLKASEKVDELTKKVDKLQAQQTALRGQFIELMEKMRELEY